MSQMQAHVINEELKQILTNRRKMKHRKKHFRREDEQAVPTGYFFIFLILIMLSRIMLDIACVIMVCASKILIPGSIGLLAVNILGSVFTVFILLCYCSKFSIRTFETLFCITWTMLYGLVTTFVLISTQSLLAASVCGYVSMITCILQGCLKFCDNSNSNQTKKKHSCEGALTNMENNSDVVSRMNGITENCEHSNKNDSSQDEDAANKSGTSITNVSAIESGSSNQKDPKNQRKLSSSAIELESLDPRIIAINNLETTIKTFLIEIHGSDYVNQGRFKFSQEINSKTHPTECDEIPNKIMTQNVANAAGMSSGTNYATQNNVTSFNSWWCCYSTYPHNDCLPAWYCCLCNCDDCCHSDGGAGDGDCCAGDCGDCCTGDCGDCCTGDCGDCCIGDCGDCFANCGDCMTCCAECGTICSAL